MRPKLAKDAALAALADSQHGVVTRSLLLNAGFRTKTSRGW
jgi:hypothetical protein